jgi:hypothetical protein
MDIAPGGVNHSKTMCAICVDVLLILQLSLHNELGAIRMDKRERVKDLTKYFLMS